MRHIKQMQINVQALNACLGIDGPDWREIDDDISDDLLTVWETPTTFKKGHTVNNGRPTSPLQKNRARQSMLKKYENGYDVSGANNPRAKTWRIVYEDGREIIIGGLQRWADDNGYSRSGIKNIAYGKWKRYRDLVTVEKVAPEVATVV